MLYEYFQAYSFKISWMLWKILPEILRSELILKQNFEYVVHKFFFFLNGYLDYFRKKLYKIIEISSKFSTTISLSCEP